VYDALASLLQSDLRDAIDRGVSATVLLDRDGIEIARTGRFDIDDVGAIAAAVTNSLHGDDVADRLFAGQLLPVMLDDREIYLGVAAQSVFVAIAVIEPSPEALAAARNLHGNVDRAVRRLLAHAPSGGVPPTAGSGGSSSGPAELQLFPPLRRRGGSA